MFPSSFIAVCVIIRGCWRFCCQRPEFLCLAVWSAFLIVPHMQRRRRTWHIPEQRPPKRPRKVEPEHGQLSCPGDPLFVATETRIWTLRRWSTGKLSSQDVCTLAWSLREARGHGLSDFSLPAPDDHTNTGKYEAHIQTALMLHKFASEHIYFAKIPMTFPRSGRALSLVFQLGDRSIDTRIVS